MNPSNNQGEISKDAISVYTIIATNFTDIMTFNEVFTFEHLYESAKKCFKGVRWKTSTQNFENNILSRVTKIYNDLKYNKYKCKKTATFIIHERGKKRIIEAPHIDDRVVSKCFCDYYLVERFSKTFIYDNGACLKGKGNSFSVKRINTHLHRYMLENGSEGYILIFDISNFFNSINHKILLNSVKHLFEDEKLFELYKYYVNSFKGDKGLGLGNQTSQVSASMFLSPLDHMIKDKLKIKYYGRYMDDGYIICKSKEKLKSVLKLIELKLQELDLRLNTKKTQIIKLTDNFTILKRRFKITQNLKIIKKPYKKNILRYKRKIKKLIKKERPYVKIKELITSFNSYLKEFNYFNRYTPKIEGANT